MTRHSSVSLKDSLAASPLAGVLKRAQMLEQLEVALLPLFPPPVPKHIRICNYEQGVLVLLVASPVWKAKMRMIKPDLIKKAEQAGIFITDIEVRTVPVLPARADDAQEKIAGSPTARKALSEAMQLLESGG